MSVNEPRWWRGAVAVAAAACVMIAGLATSGTAAQDAAEEVQPDRDLPYRSGAPDGPEYRDPRAEEILDEMIAAHGGRDAITGRETMFFKYKITNYSYPEPLIGTLTLWFTRPYLMRREIVYPQKRQTVIFDGDRCWVDDGGGPEELTQVASSIMRMGLDELDSPLMYKEGSLKYLSVARDPRGRMTQKLSWRHKGYARDLMVDANTSWLLVVGAYDTPAGPISRMQVFDDFRPVQGVMIPYKKEVIVNNQLYSATEILEIRFDGEFEDGLFSPNGAETISSSQLQGSSATPE